MRKFIELAHRQHSVFVARKDDPGNDTFVLELSADELNALSIGLAKLVDDPSKLQIQSEPTQKHKDLALELGLTSFEMLQRRFMGQHDHCWHCIRSDYDEQLKAINQVTDTHGALILEAYITDVSGSVIDPDGEPPKFPPGTTIIDTP